MEKFRLYLVDVPFKYRTDHANLKWIRESSKGRLIRWALKLDEYDMTLEPCPGKKILYVDMLSRYPIATILMLVDDQEAASLEAEAEEKANKQRENSLSWKQRQDAECQNIYSALKYGTKLYAHLAKNLSEQWFVRYDGIIYFRSEFRTVLFAPASIRQRLLFEYHGGSCAAHLGAKKVLGGIEKKVLLAVNAQ